MPRKSFYVIDGHAQIYRAYFAPFRDLSSPTGEPTKATFVFTQMLLNLIERRKPDYLAMVIDAGDETVFRKEIHAEYKANRESPPDDFYPQEERILKIVRDSGVPVFVKQGFEADDLIATIAKRLCGDDDYDVFLVSKDKDLRQVLNDCTFMYDPNGDKVIDVKVMREELGYGPEQAIDIQTLMGDKIDNVPGIPGVGEKTALELIKQFGTAEEVVKRADEIKKPKLKENVKTYGGQIGVTRQLVTLKTDVEFDFDPKNCEFRGLNLDPLRKHLRELGFNGLLAKIGTGDGAADAKPKPKKVDLFEENLFSGPASDAPSHATGRDCDYRLVNTEESFVEFISELKKQKRFAFDTETDALGPMRSNCIGMSFSWKAGTGWYVPLCGPAGSELLSAERVFKDLRPILESESIKKVGHNIKYDFLVMRQAGVDMRGIEFDSMIAAFVLDPTRLQYGIDRMALELLHFKKVPTSDLIGSGKVMSMDRVDLKRVSDYASEDADIALRIADLLEAKLKDFPRLRQLCDELETPLVDVIAEMEFNGIAIDVGVLKEQAKFVGEKIEDLRHKLMEAAGTEFNPDSPKQLSDLLFNKLKLKPGKKTKTGFSTDVEVLERLALEHDCPRLLLEYRRLTKLKNTYLDNLPEYVNPKTKRIHTSFSQIGAETGRLSSSDPNLQNIPIRDDEGRRIRLAFVPGDREKNMLLTADYSQIELRVLAHFTREPALVEAFAKDEDIHTAVAAEVFSTPLDKVSREQRAQAKIINFGIIYGISAFGLARRIEGLTPKSAQELINSYNKRFPSIQQFLQKCVMDAQSQGFVETILGRRRPLPDIHSAVLSVRNMSERMAINSVVQGSAADLIKQAMVNIHRRLIKEKRPSKMLLQVHDELVFETPKSSADAEAEMIREEMTGAMKLSVPLKVEVGMGPNWQEAK